MDFNFPLISFRSEGRKIKEFRILGIDGWMTLGMVVVISAACVLFNLPISLISLPFLLGVSKLIVDLFFATIMVACGYTRRPDYAETIK